MSAVVDSPVKAPKPRPRQIHVDETKEEFDLDALLGPDWRSLEWRLNHLYRIVDEHGDSIPFVLNEEQTDFIRNLHTRNFILKARQLGFSTLVEIMQFDQGMFCANHNGVVIADTLPNAGKLFGKVEFALKNLDKHLLEAFPIKSRTARTGIDWEHNSSLHISTSSRGGTVQLLHVSEFGKIARKWPDRAEEIVTGAFLSVPKDGCIIVETTAEGAAGACFDLAMPAILRDQENTRETALDWRLHFYPWWKKAEYRLADDEIALVPIPDAMRQYFNRMQQECGTVFDAGQRAWYASMAETLKRKMKREFPSTPMEAFEQAVEGSIFGEEMTAVREQNRITVVPLDKEYPVHTFWDFGLGARNPIWLMQRIGLQNRWVKYFDDFGKGLGWWWRTLETWRMEHGEFAWGRHYLPHDAETEILGESITTKRLILEKVGMRNVVVVPKVQSKDIGIDLMRTKLPADNWFDRIECAEGIRCIDGYQYEWDDKLVRYKNEPLGNWASHGSDAWMQYAQGYGLLGERDNGRDKVLENFKSRKRRGF